jgi:polar amino acid transport system substrate-binding protein
MRRAVLALLFAAGASWAQAPGTWRLATVDLQPAIGPRLPDQGYYAVLLRRILQEAGAQPEFLFLPPQRSLQMVINGQVEGAFPYKRTTAREADLWFSSPFFMVRIRLMLRASDRWEPQRPADLLGHTGCTLQSAQAPEALQRGIDNGQFRMERVQHIDACLRMLRLGRVAYVVAGQNIAGTHLSAQPGGAEDLRMATWVVAEEPVHLVLPRKLPGSEARLRAFNEAVRKLRQNGELQALEQQHVPYPTPARP